MGVIFGLSIFELQPKYLCRGSQDQDWYECLPPEFCHNAYIDHKVDYSRPESFNSLFNRIHLECTSKGTIGLIGSSLFLGFLVGSLFLPRIADLYGRKPCVVFGNIIFLGYLVAFLCLRSVQDALVLYFITGIGAVAAIVIAAFYYIEMFQK